MLNLGNLPQFIPDDKAEGVTLDAGLLGGAEDDTADSSTAGKDANGDSSTQKTGKQPEDLKDKGDEDQDDGDSDEDGSDGEDSNKSDKSKDIPFHKHPRFKQMLSKNKQLEEKLSKKDAEIEGIKAILKEYGLFKEEEQQTKDLNIDQLADVIAKKLNLGNQQSKDTDEDVLLEIEETLDEFEDRGEKFDRDTLVQIAAEITDGDFEKALKYYKLTEAQVQKATKTIKQSVARKKAGESLGNRKGIVPSNEDKPVIKNFNDLRADAFNRFYQS